MSLEINFIEAKPADIQDILEMMAAFYAIDKYPFDPVRSHRNLEVFLGSPELGRIWMIYNNNVLAGYLIITMGYSFEYGGGTAFIDELYLKDAHRNIGIGKRAMEFTEKVCLQQGINALHLEVENHNEKGRRLYFKQGFRANDRTLLTKRIH